MSRQTKPSSVYLNNRFALVQKIAADFDALVKVGIDTSSERAQALRLSEKIEEQLALMLRDFKRVSMQVIPGAANVKK